MNPAVRVVVLMVVVAAALAATTSVAAHPTWTSDGAEGGAGGRFTRLSDPTDGGMRLLPVLMVALPESRTPRPSGPRPDAAHKRNSELLNTLLGSQSLSHMRSAGRR